MSAVGGFRKERWRVTVQHKVVGWRDKTVNWENMDTNEWSWIGDRQIIFMLIISA